MNGEEFFKKIKKKNPLVPVVFMTAYSSVEKAVNLLKMGAYDYITKPLELDEVNHIVDKLVEKHPLSLWIWAVIIINNILIPGFISSKVI